MWTSELQEGDNQYKVDIADMRLESGIYQLIFTTGDFYQTQKVYVRILILEVPTSDIKRKFNFRLTFLKLSNHQ